MALEFGYNLAPMLFWIKEPDGGFTAEFGGYRYWISPPPARRVTALLTGDTTRAERRAASVLGFADNIKQAMEIADRHYDKVSGR